MEVKCQLAKLPGFHPKGGTWHRSLLLPPCPFPGGVLAAGGERLPWWKVFSQLNPSGTKTLVEAKAKGEENLSGWEGGKLSYNILTRAKSILKQKK